MRLLSLSLCGVALTAVLLATAAGCGPGGSSVTPVVGNAAPASFAAVSGAPTTLSGSNQAVSLPTIPGVTSVGGSIIVTANTPVTAVITVSSSSSGGTTGGPPVALESIRRHAQQSGSGPTPLYYVGVTNTTNTPQTVTFSTLTLNTTGAPSGSQQGLAHYDPSQPQNGWNQHCAFGSGQVSQNGNNTTFTPNANLTIYPGATLWFAPYTIPAGAAAPTPAPQGSGVTPTPAPAPASLTGTYVGSYSGQNGSGYLEIAITQSGSNVTGTYAAPPTGPSSGGFGLMSGTVAGSTLSLTLIQQYGGNCGGGTVSATASGTLIYGTFTQAVTNSCPPQAPQPFSVALQTANLPAISGTYTGPITDSVNGSGTLTLTVSNPGTVFSGTGTVNYPQNSQANGTNAVVGFVTSATSGEFAVIGGPQQNCNPFGTFTISGSTLNGSYGNSGGGNNNSCNGTGSFSITQ